VYNIPYWLIKNMQKAYLHLNGGFDGFWEVLDRLDVKYPTKNI
jgi:hypothetical protein